MPNLVANIAPAATAFDLNIPYGEFEHVAHGCDIAEMKGGLEVEGSSPVMELVELDELDDVDDLTASYPSLPPMPSFPIAPVNIHNDVVNCNINVAAATVSETKTVIIFDWDDTLLASTFLSAGGFRLDTTEQFPDDMNNQLKELESSVIGLLNLSLNVGHTCIITNAENGWVQLSAQKFLPGVLPLLNKIGIVSARSTYECFYPECPSQWKLEAFSERLKHFPNHGDKNIISFGDSQAEREAVHAVTKDLLNTRTKSIKFVERPSITQLRRQIELVTNYFRFICEHKENLDLMLTVRNL